MSFSFGREHRLLNTDDFQQVFDSVDIRLSKKNLLILVRRIRSEKPRLGIIISRKNIKLSVDRNRCKRIIRESFRIHQSQLQGCELVLLARKGLAGLSNDKLHQILKCYWYEIVNKQ